MFKKGFLNSYQLATAAKEAKKPVSPAPPLPLPSLIWSVSPEAAQPVPCARSDRLPPELVLQIIDHVLEGDAHSETQRDIAALRLSSRPDQAAQRSTYPTRYNSWYLVGSHVRAPAIRRVKPAALAIFDQIEDVAFCNAETHEQFPWAVHYAFRDVGPWCASVALPEDYIYQMICTPTLRAIPAPGQSHAPLREDEPPQRAIFACHLVVPVISLAGSMYWLYAKTITHLTISSYLHDRYIDLSFDEVVPAILDRCNLPLLENLTIRLVHFGDRPNGMYSRDELSPGATWPIPEGRFCRKKIALKDENKWKEMVWQYETVLNEQNDPRTHFETLRKTGLRPDKCFDDVRMYAREMWQERVAGRAGPWKSA